MMSIPVSTADNISAPAGSAAAGHDEPTPDDRWRTGDLPTLRAELDRIDDAVHDLLMQRAQIVEFVARSGKPAAFRPGREASIIRRLLHRHNGALPPLSVVRVWRELLAGTTMMQGGFSVAVCDTLQGATLTQLAREHFGALTPLQSYASAGQALVAVSQGAASVAVLTYPSEGNNWWVALLHHEPRLHVIGRLPFWRSRPNGAPIAEALVVGATPADASEEDRSLLGLECDSDVSRARISNALSGAGLKPEAMILVRQHDTPIANVLVDIEGALSDNDPRLKSLGAVLRGPIVLGTYAVPVGGSAR